MPSNTTFAKLPRFASALSGTLSASLTGAIGVLLFGLTSHAQVSFTQAEIAQDQAHALQISQVAAQCVDSYYQEQQAFFGQWHMSKFYGNRRPDYATPAGRISAMESKGVSHATAVSIASQQRSTACITMAMDCLGKGFVAAGMGPTWQKIYAHLAIDNRFAGTDLQTDLHALGWKVYYWNPDPSQNQAWDAEDRALNPLAAGRKWMPVWGGHQAHYVEATRRGVYAGVPVDDVTSLVGFGKQAPASFARVPFFVGSAHAGYHVFPGRNGQVIEAHSTRDIGSIDNIQYSPFSPLADGGGPRWTAHEHYRSGVIAVPPGF